MWWSANAVVHNNNVTLCSHPNQEFDSNLSSRLCEIMWLYAVIYSTYDWCWYLPESGDNVESIDDSVIVDVDNGDEFDWLPEKGPRGSTALISII